MYNPGPVTSRFMYGLFNQALSVGDHLIPGVTAKAITGSIYSSGYEEASDQGKLLFISSRICNAEVIRKELDLPAGSTAELVLALISREGVKGCRRLNGKFTIILRQNSGTTIIRDRNGEGPVIYFTRDFFTDSYQKLPDFGSYQAVPDMTGITTFLKIGYIPAPHTALAGVNKVPAGAILSVSGGGLHYDRLFDFQEILYAERNSVTEEDAVQTYTGLLKNSLRSRIGDAGTIGVLLSGGYDSGGNIAMSRLVHPGKIKTFSVGFKDNPASELPFARMMAEKFGSEHHEYVMDGTEIEFLPEIIDILGDPFSESGFMLNYSVMKYVSSENLPVVIGGDGNDQFFGAGIRETALHYKMGKYGLMPLSKLFDRLGDNSFFDKDNLAFRVHFQNRKILRVMEPETFGFNDFQLGKMFNMKTIPPHDYLKIIPGKSGSFDELFLRRNYYLHLQHSVNEVILFKASRMSESFGVNLAFPYADLDVYHFLQHLPVSLRAKGSVDDYAGGRGVSKHIHKLLIKPMLPEAVTNRPKQGGFSPLEIFFGQEKIRRLIYRYIKGSAWASSVKPGDFLDGFFRQYEALATGKPYWFWYKQVKSSQLINLLIIALWWDKMFENRKSGKLTDYLES